MTKEEFKIKAKYSEANGVSAIVDSNIDISMNEYGYYAESIIDENIPLSEMLEKVMPVLNETDSEESVAEKLYSQVPNIKYDNAIGYFLNLYAGYVQEDDYRANASSGGMTSWICAELLKKKYVDGIIHVKSNKQGSPLFQYSVSYTVEEIKEGAGTKYYPVEFSNTLKNVIDLEKKYAITGTPGAIYSFRLLSKYNQDYRNSIIFTIGLICGHLKSSKFAEYMGWQLGIKPGDLLDIDFRVKLPEYKSSDYGIRVKGYRNDEVVDITVPKSSLLGQDWGQAYFKLISSDFTTDVFNETADIVLGDAWLPEYTSDSEGNNIVIVRNSLIANLIENAIKEKRLKLDLIDKNKIFKSQKSHYRHTFLELPYRIQQEQKNSPWVPNKIIKTNQDLSVSFSRKLIQNIRSRIRTESHIHYKRAVELKDINYFNKHMKKLTVKYKLIYLIAAIEKRLRKTKN